MSVGEKRVGECVGEGCGGEGGGVWGRRGWVSVGEKRVGECGGEGG